jgi:hypothetical protein
VGSPACAHARELRRGPGAMSFLESGGPRTLPVTFDPARAAA